MSTGETKSVEGRGAEFAAFGPFRLFPATRRLERDEKHVEIGGRALDVLIELVRRAGQVVSKTELMASIWADTTVVEGALRTHVYNLRKTLSDGVGGVRYVTSVAGRGYCFVAPVIRGEMGATSPVAPSARQLVHRLPQRLARMAGRDEIVRTLAAKVLEHRFVTISGAAGIGKTTVAVAVAHALLNDFGDAAHFVELGALTDPALVASTVASTLGVPVQTDDPVESLRAFLRDRRVLLVLDNCEHVVEAAANLAEDLFLRAPRVHLLTTSREGLRVEGEHIHHLGPLETPMDHVGLTADTVQRFPAVQVYLERAAARGWSADLTDADVPMVVDTCRRLDGIPLALELSASFVGEFGLHGMTSVLDDGLRFLRRRGRRTAPPRQQTLHALVAWSYDRLLERERVTLRRLSVFVGAFPFDAAKAIVHEPADSDDSLAEVMNELVGKSLLSASAEGGAVVHRLLETTRVYALERLAESGELERVSLRHAAFFAERVGRLAYGGERPFPKQPSVLANVRAALQWSFASPTGQAQGAMLAGASARMLIDLGLLSECRARCRQALGVLGESDAGTLVELRLQEGLALSTMWGGYGDGVRPALDRGLELARRLGGGDHEVRLLEHLNFLMQRTGDLLGALEVAELSVTAARVGTTAAKVTSHWMLARSHYMCGHQVLALDHCEAGMRLAAMSGREPATFVGYTPAVLCLARVLWLHGQVDRALTQARDIVREGAALNHPVYQCIRLMHCLPIIAWHGKWDEAQHMVDVLDELIEGYSLGSYRGFAMAFRGKLLVETGRPHEGCHLLQTAASTLKTARLASLDAYFTCALAECLAAAGSLDDAFVAVEGGIEQAQRRGGTWELPELLRLKGVLLASRSPTDARAVDETLSAAIELARRQGALVWELRAATALARERLKRGSTDEAFGDLSAVYAKFTEGTDAPDLQAARNLLERRTDVRLDT